MMKLKSVSGITCYVKNVNRTVKFYETLGFAFRKREPNHATAYLNWFWIDFISIHKEAGPEFRKEAKLGNKGAGVFLYISVENVDDFHKALLSKGLKPSSEPRDSRAGNREFILRDPDGYKIVIFKRI